MIDIILTGGPVMYPLLICSVIALAVVLDRSIFWFRNGKTDNTVSVAKLCEMAECDSPGHTADTNQDIVMRVLRIGLKSRGHELSWLMQQAASAEVDQMNRHLGILNTMVSLAPLLGIFGTVLGIIESFQLIGGGAMTDPTAATGGLAQALITTAFGLGIAMPSLIAFKVFESKTVKMKSKLESRCSELEWRLGPVTEASDT